MKDLKNAIESLSYSVNLVKSLEKLELKPDLILVDHTLNKKFLKTTISIIEQLDLPFIYISNAEEGFNTEIIDHTNYFGTLIKPIN